MEQREWSRKRPPMEPVLVAGRRSGGKTVKKQRIPNTRKQKRRKSNRRHPINIILKFMSILMIGYMAVSLYYKDIFLPNTVIGGIEVSGKTTTEVWETVREGIECYQLVIEERDGRKEVIEGRTIGLQPVYDESLNRIMEKQNSFLWAATWLRGETYEQHCMVEYDKEKLKALISNLECLNPEQITEPADARLTWEETKGLVIVPEVKGNKPVYERLVEEIAIAVNSLKPKISLDELGVYKEPEITMEDPGLSKQKEQWEKYASVNITYQFGSQSEIVNGAVVTGWLTENETGDVLIDRVKVDEYVKGLAKKYNTAYCMKELKTSYGPTVKITQGHYGWMIDRAAEAEQLMNMIEEGKSGKREPIYLQTANSHDGPDYGDTYVELNLTAQHLFYYKNGKLLIESDFVSGNEEKGWSTPAGAYELTYKQKNATLKGSNYRTPVTYWMPFNGNIGMHDGYWRSSFGGTIYKKNGSHGCVNLPPAVAKTIFENLEKGTPVLCYHLDGTETNKTTTDTSGGTNRPAGKEQESITAVPAPVETPSPEIMMPETEPAELVPSEAAPEENALEESTPAGPAQDQPAQMEIVPVSDFCLSYCR